MANNTLAKNIAQAATDFADIKTAIIEKGVDVPGGTPTAEYDDLIRQIPDVDLSDVVKYDGNRDVNLTGEGDVIVDNGKGIKNNTGSNLIKSQASAGAGKSLEDLPVGYNLRGKTIHISNTHLSYAVSNNASGIRGTNGLDIYIQASDGFQASGFGFNKVLRFSDGEWLLTELTIPDEMDYIIESNTLGEAEFTGDWNVSYAVVDRVLSGITVGDKTLHTQIDSADRPTWEGPSGTKTFVMEEDLPDPDLTNVVKFDAGRNVDLTGEGDIILNDGKQIKNNPGKNIAKTNSATTDIGLIGITEGFNFRGKTIHFNRTDLDYALTGGSGSIIGSNSLYIFLGEHNVSIYGDGFVYPVWSITEGWLTSSVTIPDDRDYIVTANTLSEIYFAGAWNLNYASVIIGQPSVTLGDNTVHTHIDSSDRPTWDSPTGRKTFAMEGDLPDLTNVVKFDDGRNVDLTGEGNLIMDRSKQILSDIGRNIASTTNEQTDIHLNVVPDGFNFRGKTLRITNSSTEFYPSVNVELAGSNGLSIKIGPDTFTVDYDGNSIVLFSTGGWENNTVVFPDDKDYIVAFNEINHADFAGNWHIHYAVVSSSSYGILYGDINVPTRIDSSVRPTWGTKQLATLDDISGEGGENVVIFDIDNTLFNGFEVSETITEAEYNRLANAVTTNKVIIFNLINKGTAKGGYAIATISDYLLDGSSEQYRIIFAVDFDKGTQTIVQFNKSGSTYNRWFYTYPFKPMQLANNFYQTQQTGILALDAALGQYIVNTDYEQGISGLKIFDRLPQSGATPTGEWDMTTKKYVDSLQPVIITQADYDALGAAVEFNGITYYIIPNPAYPGEVEAAPEPTEPAINVKKIYSSKYGTVSNIEFPDWSGGVTVGSALDNEGKQVIKMVDLGYQPISFYGNDITNNNRTLKFYIYSAVDIPDLELKAIDPEGTGAVAGSLPVPANTWTLFTAPVPASIAKVTAIQFTVEGSIRYDIYLDHIYII